jgi:cold shock CspA family protein
MAKSKQTYQKSEKEKKKRLKQKEKDEKREFRKTNSNKGKGFESMIAYVDHNGRLSDSPPDPKLRPEVKAEDIMLGARSFDREVNSDFKTGRVAIWNNDRKFGFIKEEISQKKIFFHYSDVDFEVQEGDLVKFELTSTAKGLSAVGVTRHEA